MTHKDAHGKHPHGFVLINQPYPEWRCYNSLWKAQPTCLKQSAVHVNSEAVMQADYLANWERLPNYEKLSQTV